MTIISVLFAVVKEQDQWLLKPANNYPSVKLAWNSQLGIRFGEVLGSDLG